MNKKVGKRVADARRQAGMTQELLAEKLNVSVSAVSRLETGSNMVSLERLLDISEILNVGLQDLLCDLFVYTAEEETISNELEMHISRMNANEKMHLLKYIQLMKELLR